MLFPPRWHRYIFILSLAVILASLPFSKVGVSVGFITLYINFLLDGNWHEKVVRFKINRTLLFIALLIYLPILYNLLYSTYPHNSIRLLQLWLPMLLTPWVIALSKPLQKNELKLLIRIFVLSVLVASFIGIGLYLKQEGAFDRRTLSPYVSHIRLSLMLNLAIVFLGNGIFGSQWQCTFRKFAALLLILWLIVFLLILQSLTGIIMLGLACFMAILWHYPKFRPVQKRTLLITAMLILTFSLCQTTAIINQYYQREPISWETLPRYTPNGIPYYHDSTLQEYEGRYYLYAYICHEELRSNWNKRSALPFDGLDRKGQKLSQTLIRYLTSLGYPKDSLGVWQLDSTDLALIENGYTNIRYRYSSNGLKNRILETLRELELYRNRGFIAHSSLIQRLVFARAAWFVISRNPVLGVGYGDLKPEMEKYYTNRNINLPPELHYMPHNQYLTLWGASGAIGLLMFLIGFIAPLVISGKHRQFTALFFFVMVLTSMLWEDTLDTHIGISFTAIFWSLAIFGGIISNPLCNGNTSEPRLLHQRSATGSTRTSG